MPASQQVRQDIYIKKMDYLAILEQTVTVQDISEIAIFNLSRVLRGQRFVRYKGNLKSHTKSD